MIALIAILVCLLSLGVQMFIAGLVNDADGDAMVFITVFNSLILTALILTILLT